MEALLTIRLGEPDTVLLATALPLLTFSSDNYTRLILRSSREEILAQFPPDNGNAPTTQNCS
jgi:hypothetical protein